MVEQLKALVVKMPFEKDLGNVIAVARAEGMKIFHNPGKVVVVDIVRREYGWIVVVVQTGDSGIPKALTG